MGWLRKIDEVIRTGWKLGIKVNKTDRDLHITRQRMKKEAQRKIAWDKEKRVTSDKKRNQVI